MTIRKIITTVTAASGVAVLCAIGTLSLNTATRAADPIRPTKVWPTEVAPALVQPAIVTPATPDNSQPVPPTPFLPANPNPVPPTADILVPGPAPTPPPAPYVQWRNLGKPPEPIVIVEETKPQPEPAPEEARHHRLMNFWGPFGYNWFGDYGGYYNGQPFAYFGPAPEQTGQKTIYMDTSAGK